MTRWLEEPVIALSPLASLERRLQLLRDLVAAVARGYKTGLFLYGAGGIGKSHTVLRELARLDMPHHVLNSRITAKGLFDALAASPDHVLVLEDVERVQRDPTAAGVLRSALWAVPGRDRVVTWTTGTDGTRRVTVRGGVIMISNRPLANLPELDALATRIEVLRLEVPEPELVALMYDLAGRGIPGVAPNACRVVTDHLLAECRAAGCPLDLRLQQKAFQTYRQWAADHCHTHWKDLVATSVREAADHFRHAPDPRSQEERQAERRRVLREIIRETQDSGEQLKLYMERAGASKADFYRRKSELKSREFDPEVETPGR